MNAKQSGLLIAAATGVALMAAAPALAASGGKNYCGPRAHFVNKVAEMRGETPQQTAEQPAQQSIPQQSARQPAMSLKPVDLPAEE